MAANKFDLSAVRKQEDLETDGHDVYYFFSLYNAAKIPRKFTFTQNYFTPCTVTPTVWKFTMTLHRNPDSDVVSGSTKLERLERIKWVKVPDPTTLTPVSAHFLLKFHHMDDFRIDYTLGAFSYQMFLPSMKKETYIETIVPNERMDFLHKEIYVVLQISVRKCHSLPQFSLPSYLLDIEG